MNIAFLHYDLPPVAEGGVAYQVDLLARVLSRKHMLTMFTTTPTSVEREYTTKQVRLNHPGRLTRSLGIGIAFGRLDLSNFDLVHAHGDSWAVKHRAVVRTFYGTAIQEARSATSLKRKAAQTLQYGLELVAAARADVRTAISQDTAGRLPGIDYVIPAGVDDEVFYPGTNRFEEPTVVLVAGRLGGRKRGWLALDAFREARRRVPNAQLILITRDLVREPGVRCLSAISSLQLADLYRRAWVLLSASKYEGFGLPYAEALLSGLPVVTTINVGAQEVLAGTDAALVSDNTLSHALVATLLKGPRPYVVPQCAERFRVAHVADQFDKLYSQVLV